jgi:hypothetical protein
MDSQILEIFSKVVFGGSIALLIYIVYYEFKKSQFEAEQDEIEMGELENENAIDNSSDADVTDAINKIIGGSGDPPPKK